MSNRPDDRLQDILFFFQAEDGIRDLTVTGVQTCALPISLPGRDSPSQRVRQGKGQWRCAGRSDATDARRQGGSERYRRAVLRGQEGGRDAEIGRASCRERV